MDMQPPINLESFAKIRRPAVAGYFYPESVEALQQDIDKFCTRQAASKKSLAVVMPHGPFQFSGALAGQAIAQVVIPKRCIIIGPSHTGSFIPWSILPAGWYRTPLGDVPVDADLSQLLKSRCAFLEADAWSQKGEHSIEAVLPFLQRRGPEGLSIVPIVCGSDDEAQAQDLALAIAQAIRMVEEPVLLIASANLSHYEPRAITIRQDALLIERIRDFDAQGLVRLVREEGMRVCGTIPLAVVLLAAKHLGASQAELTGYATSADFGGDADSSIGFAGFSIQ